MNIVAIKLKKTLKVEQKISFDHAPAKALGVFSSGANITAFFTVDPSQGPFNCEAWVQPNNAAGVEGACLGSADGGRTFVFSNCFA